MKSYHCLFVFTIFLSANLWAQDKKIWENQLLFRSNHIAIYMICKGTRSKTPIVAKEFNYIDTNSTHVAMGIMENGKLTIYNMINTPGKIAFRKDFLDSFLMDDDITYFSIWETVVSSSELKRCRKYIAAMVKRNPGFDTMFDLDNGDSLLYCSEFCHLALMAANSRKFSFEPRKMVLNNSLFEQVLGRKMLTYIPVDFFQQKGMFKKIYEKFIHN